VRGRAACLLLGIVLVLPALGAGFFGDDYLQIVTLERPSLAPARALDLYSFVPGDPAAVERMRDGGVLPYFTPPGLEIAFLRPLSSALMGLDHALFGRRPLGYHAHTLLWYAALLAVAAALLERAAPSPLGALALLVFCLDDAHAMAVTFVAARNAMVSCVLVWLALLAHLRWRQAGWRPGALLAPALAALGLAGGEMGLAALAYLVAWEVTERRPGWGRALIPTLALVAAYLVAYRAIGAGAHASAAYLDPFGDPGGFLRELPARILLLLGCLLAGAPIDLALLDERLRLPLIAVGAATALVVALWLPRALRRMSAAEAGAVRWLGLGAAGALVAATPGLTGERLLLAAGLGGAVVIAALLRDAWRMFRDGRRAWVVALLALGAPNLALAPLTLAGKTLFFGKVFAEFRRVARDAEIAAPVPARVVIVALNDLLALQLPAVRAIEEGRTPDELVAIGAARAAGAYAGLALPDRFGYRGTTVLSLASTEHRLRRTAPDELELSTPNGTLFDGTWVGTLRAASLPLPRGAVVRTSFMTATVLDDRDGRPTRVAFHFDRPLDNPSLVFLAPEGHALRHLEPPPVGAEIAIPRLPPMGR